MTPSPRWLLPLAGALGVALLAACHAETEAAAQRPGHPPTCVDLFAQCAPPATWARTADASRLELRRLVQASMRLDVPAALSRDAAARVLEVVRTADVQGLVELDAIREGERTILGKCQCPGGPTEWQRKGIDAVLDARLPPAELRSPRTWENRIVRRLAEIRELTTRMAMRRLSGKPADDLEIARLDADAELCRAVHAARTFLLPGVYRDLIEEVHRRREAEAGAATAGLGCVAVQGHEKAASSAPARPGGERR